MKFGKQFRLLTAHLSYASSFVDYKALKQIFTNEKNSKKPEDLQKRFEMAIKAEVAKVSIMYKRTLKLAKSKWEKVSRIVFWPLCFGMFPFFFFFLFFSLSLSIYIYMCVCVCVMHLPPRVWSRNVSLGTLSHPLYSL